MASFSLEDDLSCPVCCEVYQDPQLLPCGHSFCRRCLDRHGSGKSSRTCAVCRQVSEQRPVSNLSLRNACESFLREKEKGSDGGVVCPQHGERVKFFCETDKELLCTVCRKHSHRSHKVQPLAQVVEKCKREVKVALRPALDALDSLRYSTVGHTKNNLLIQAQRTERLIKKEFGKLHQFLKEEEEEKISALREEEERKTEYVEESVKHQLESLLGKVRYVEDQLENDDITFMQNYAQLLQRAQYNAPDPQLDSGTLIDVAKHLGNLRYEVWEKMKSTCSFYPVVLDPNSAPTDFSISDNLACVEKSTHIHPCPGPHQRSQVVLGFKGYRYGFHCWDVEVGDSRHWTIGVCSRSAARNAVRNLTPENGFWGLCREGDVCKVLGSTSSWPWCHIMPRTVRVKLGRHFLRRTVSFYDTNKKFKLSCSIELPSDEELFPFLIPGEQSSPLRILPNKVMLNMEQKFNCIEWYIDVQEILMTLCMCCLHGVGYVIFYLVCFLVAIFQVLMSR
ncbi:E3 ubiquitin-protein ligase TRIM35-like [Hoplias malabaricus]|uniref:E3 ubiquitin-protein ligase TRIM35-like n=1 Tax=Hoplias malabaricus TaxID=27720 RepID=UPI003462B2BB